MIDNSSYFDILDKPRITKKMSYLFKKNNVLVFQTKIKYNKFQLLRAIKEILNVDVKKIRVLLVKRKRKKIKNKFYFTKAWKKVYVFLEKKVDLSNLI